MPPPNPQPYTCRASSCVATSMWPSWATPPAPRASCSSGLPAGGAAWQGAGLLCGVCRACQGHAPLCLSRRRGIAACFAAFVPRSPVRHGDSPQLALRHADAARAVPQVCGRLPAARRLHQRQEQLRGGPHRHRGQGGRVAGRGGGASQGRESQSASGARARHTGSASAHKILNSSSSSNPGVSCLRCSISAPALTLPGTSRLCSRPLVYPPFPSP